MSGPRVAAWIIGAAVCGAWLASAAGVTRQARSARPAPTAPDVVAFDALAADVQAQAGRLRARLAQAPAPSAEGRNPFAFSVAPAPRRPRAAPVDPAAPPVPLPPAEASEPALELIGVAESAGAGGPVRTAMITGPMGELMMVTAGARILGRYEVGAVGADAVDLKDLQTGAVRRLVLR